MNHVYWVVEELVGGRCGPACVPWEPKVLHAGGIRGVVSLDDENVNERHLREAGINHLPIYQPMTLLYSVGQRQVFLDCLPPIFDFIDQQRRRQAPVIVHCYYGCDRTGTVLSCYLMAREGLTAQQAIARVRKGQPSALQALGYQETVELFVERLGNRESGR